MFCVFVVLTVVAAAVVVVAVVAAQTETHRVMHRFFLEHVLRVLRIRSRGLCSAKNSPATLGSNFDVSIKPVISLDIHELK